MADVGHSRLLKFFVAPKMADSINESNGISSVVPGAQKIRTAEETENAVANKDDFTLSPVITVTKKEASFTKGDLKLQKVTVTEDISNEASTAEGIDEESMKTYSEDNKISETNDTVKVINCETEEEVKKVSKIPRLRFRAAVNKIRSGQRSLGNDKKEINNENRRRSSIPRLKGNKSPPPKEEAERKRESINFDDLISNVTEADFDKIYEEIVEKPNVLDECENTTAVSKDPTTVETKFDEIIHAYDTNKIEPLKIDKSKSKIPLLKRKSEHDIEVKTVRQETQRKGSLGKIPISFSYSEKLSSFPKRNIPQSNNIGTNDDLETANTNNLTPAVATVTKIPLGDNKYGKISSIVLNKQPIRANSTDNNKLKQSNVETRKSNKKDEISDTEIILQKAEVISIMDVERNEEPSLPLRLKNSIELNATTPSNTLREECVHLIDNKIKEIPTDGDKSKKNSILYSENESSHNNNEVTVSTDENMKPSCIRDRFSYNDNYNDFNSISKIDLKSPEPKIEHEIESLINNNNDDNDYSKYDLIKVTKSSPKINESEVVIKYKPEIKEVKVTKDNHSINLNKNTDNNFDDKNKRLYPNESLTDQPIKYKTITASQTVAETNEEDIIILKGKVNRVISRLDSVEPKLNKKPLDDLPKQSVKSKISLFECNDSKPIVIKNKAPKSHLIHAKDDKPRVIEGILKDSNEIEHYKDSSKTKISANLENTLANDRIKIAYGLKDELDRWKKNNIKNSEKINKPATDVDDNEHDILENNSKETPTAENDVFAKTSADIVNSYKLSQQKKNINVESDMKKAKSLADLDLGDTVARTVKKMVYRIKSVDKIEHRKEIINLRERPRKGSVSERIALFEGRSPKAEPLKRSVREMTNPVAKTPVKSERDERIHELATAAAKYGSYGNISYVEMGGVRVPALWVGTAMKGSGVTKEVVKTAIELGYRAFDTAYVYGTEQEVGQAIREKIADGTVTREELFVAGKLWSTFHRRDLALQACRDSLQQLGLDYFDLYMIHNPMSFKEGGAAVPRIANVVQYSEHDYLEAWLGLEAAVGAGLARAAGLSNFNTAQIQRILDKGRIRPVVNQVESHPYLTQLGLGSFCSERGILLSVFGTLGSKGTPAEYKSDLPPVIDDPLIIAMAAGLGITPAQLLISYQLTLGRAVVVKCSSGARLWENLHAQATPLHPDHVRALHNLNRNQRIFTFKGMGDTHKDYPFTEL